MARVSFLESTDPKPCMQTPPAAPPIPSSNFTSHQPHHPTPHHPHSEEFGALRILLYAGDQDTVCSVAGIALWLDSMQWRTKEDWAPWFLPGEQQRAAGRIRTYENGVVFVTVDGAGHEAPAFRAKESLFIFSQFLQGGLL